MAIILLFLAILPVIPFIKSQRNWLVPFTSDLVTWASHPQIAGELHATEPLLTVVVAVVLCTSIGWVASTLVLDQTQFASAVAMRTGLALILGICTAGYIGMLAVDVGQLDRGFVGLATTGLVVFVVVLLYLTRRYKDIVIHHVAMTRPSWQVLAAAIMATAVLIFVFGHAALSPVTEWDAVVYHAGSAKLWFLEAPNPPLIYGPSVGIEISANYPPLFPAAGAVVDVLLGSFQDLFLRLESPALLAGLLLVIYSYCSNRFGSRGAGWAVILSTGTPLLILYGTWATGYMLVTSLVFAVVVLCEEAAITERYWTWTSAGVIAGLAILSQFYGLPSLAVAAAALILRRFSRRNLLGVVLFGGTALVVASPWLIRNALLLHDPIYPIPLPLLHPIGLIEPLWGASQAEIRNNALGQWSGQGSGLLVQQILTALFDRHLLPVGTLFALALGAWRAARGDYWSAYMVGVITLFIATVMAPGWFFVRALVVIVPLVAVLTARGITMLADGDALWRFRRGRVIQGAARASQPGIFAACAIVGLTLAIAGPNQETWTTELDANHDMMASVRALGSDSAALYNVYGGDYLSWRWLNSNLSPTQRVATLDNRLYFFDRPQKLFYLDGGESAPLLNLNEPDTARMFLASQSVRFIMIPGWTGAPGPAQHPAIGLLPLIAMLGDTEFPIAAMFGDVNGNPTVIYSVGPYSTLPEPGLFPGRRSRTLFDGSGQFMLADSDTSPRVFAPAFDGGPTSLQLRYRLVGKAQLTINRWDPVARQWIDGVYTSGANVATDKWIGAEVPLAGSQGFTVFGLFSSGGGVYVRDLTIRRPTDPVVYAGAGVVQPGGTYVLASKDTSNRIVVPIGDTLPRILSFQFLDQGGGQFDLKELDPASGQWVTVNSISVDHQGGWLSVATPVNGQSPFSEFAIYDDGPDITIRSVSLSSDVVVVSPVPHEPGAPYIFPRGTTSGRIYVATPIDRSATVTLTYLDSPGTFTINTLDDYSASKWQYGTVILRRGTGSWKTITIPLHSGAARIVALGPYAYQGDLSLSAATVRSNP